MQASEHRLGSLEGLRGYLALWVVFYHSLYSGWQVPKSLSGARAVEVFVILSGFVIFYLLDQRKESAFQFICRRFFRLYPAFILLFLVALWMSQVLVSNVQNGNDYFLPGWGDRNLERLLRWDEYRWCNIVLHGMMFHGVVPQQIIPYAPTAYLIPAWSISLEWQFYLIAPLCYAMMARANLRLVFMAVILLLVVAAWLWFPHVEHGAFLPMKFPLFLIGMASYFVFRNGGVISVGRRFRLVWSSKIGWIVALCGLIMVFGMGLPANIIALCIWAVVLGVISDVKMGRKRWEERWLAHPVSQFLGKISYSVYLVHMLVIFGVQFFFIQYLSRIEKGSFFALTTLLTVLMTIPISALLYKMVELPGIRCGKNVAGWCLRRIRGAKLT